MIRPATHAGSWYERSPKRLQQQIEGWVQQARSAAATPQRSARFAIGPHAGYRFCGPVLAHTYAGLDASIERVVLMGPSHFKYFRGVRTSAYAAFETPLGDLKVDTDCVATLRAQCRLATLEEAYDCKEHSWEMHLPFVALLAPQARIVPLLFGGSDASQTQHLIDALAPLVDCPRTAFVVSSDFCHWGDAFDYTPFVAEAPEIYKHIAALDHEGIALLTKGAAARQWEAYIRRTKNTICGAKPIEFLLALAESEGRQLRFAELAYSQSSQARNASDSSVSYAALIALD